jgi:uncharacterized membrane protein YccF (DUF307 family)
MTTPPPPAPNPTVVVRQRRGPGCLVQILWFAIVGWWLGGAAVSLAWLLNITIIGLPVGMAILNNIPMLIALQEPETTVVAVSTPRGTVVQHTETPQYNFLLRALFFVVVGWWWSGIWLALAYSVSATVILLPIGLEMFRLTPAMTTLRRY